MSDDICVEVVEPGTRPEVAAVQAPIRSGRGGEIAVLHPFLLNSAPIASAWEPMLTAVRNRTEIAADLRELAILRVAVLNRASFEFAPHVPPARAASLGEERIQAVETWAEDQAPSSEDRGVAEQSIGGRLRGGVTIAHRTAAPIAPQTEEGPSDDVSEYAVVHQRSVDRCR